MPPVYTYTVNTPGFRYFKIINPPVTLSINNREHRDHLDQAAPMPFQGENPSVVFNLNHSITW
jgi:hypothetical protein